MNHPHHDPRLHSQQGLTLIELFVAVTIGFVVILAMGQIDITRLHLLREIRQRAVSGPTESRLALAHSVKRLQQADRIQLLSGSDIQLRVPTGTNLDDAASFQWMQYRYLAGNQIAFYDPASSCAVSQLFHDIGGLAIAYLDVAPSPPGTEPLLPGGEDNNVLEITVTSTQVDPQTNTPFAFTGQVTMRAGAYTDVTTGLAPPTVSDPPNSC